MDEIIVLQFLFIHLYYSLFHRFLKYYRILNRILYVIYQLNVQTFLGDDSPRQDFQFCLLLTKINGTLLLLLHPIGKEV